ncbi:hypothetical protein NW762_007964 [Fusarium torreyae]|uniref:Zn(2)-C6 fungal-type domain-containing protein n=1 Tax=Fusarium torreyae TaxID=1237075 RepID=A0A9W8RZV0_9HYPO|nr:hypothetical protein NW762_007964 [Fusarium torreyae]
MPSPEPRRACDRCHSLKERCYWPQGKGIGAASCARCRRLGFECLVKRPSKRLGRPRLFAKPVRIPAALSHNLIEESSSQRLDDKDPTYLASTPKPVLVRPLSQFNDLTASDKQLIQNMLFSDVVLDRFLIGPTFREQHRKFLISHFVISQYTLKHAFLAVGLACEHQPTIEPYKHASLAMKQLRQYTVTSKQGVSECLALGAMIISFTYYCSTSPNAAPVCNQTLSLVKETYESRNDLEPDDLVFISCLILPELLNSMMIGSLPSLRFRNMPGLSDFVDRYIGLFAPLLPYLYDICELNHALSQAGSEDLPGLLRDVDEIEQLVKAWQPQIQQNLRTQFSATEVSQMLCQSQVMKLGAMLLIHRLRHPFGTNNGPALAMANSILYQLDLVQAATNRSILYITLPLIAACFEIHEKDQRQIWLSKVPKIVGYSAGFTHYVKDLVKTFWDALDDLREMNWYSVEHILSLYK